MLISSSSLCFSLLLSILPKSIALYSSLHWLQKTSLRTKGIFLFLIFLTQKNWLGPASLETNCFTIKIFVKSLLKIFSLSIFYLTEASTGSTSLKLSSTFCGLLTLSIALNLTIWLYYNDMVLSSLGKFWQVLSSSRSDKRVTNCHEPISSNSSPSFPLPCFTSHKKAHPHKKQQSSSPSNPGDETEPSPSPQTVKSSSALVSLLSSPLTTWSARCTSKSVDTSCRLGTRAT